LTPSVPHCFTLSEGNVVFFFFSRVFPSVESCGPWFFYFSQARPLLVSYGFDCSLFHAQGAPCFCLSPCRGGKDCLFFPFFPPATFNKAQGSCFIPRVLLVFFKGRINLSFSPSELPFLRDLLRLSFVKPQFLLFLGLLGQERRPEGWRVDSSFEFFELNFSPSFPFPPLPLFQQFSTEAFECRSVSRPVSFIGFRFDSPLPFPPPCCFIYIVGPCGPRFVWHPLQLCDWPLGLNWLFFSFFCVFGDSDCLSFSFSFPTSFSGCSA